MTRSVVSRWVGPVLGVLSVLAVLLVALMPSAAPEGAAPQLPVLDTAALPAVQFAQLVDVVSRAAEAGDVTTARNQTQRALAIYLTIPAEARTVDIRYHAGIMMAVAGDPPGALAQADSIQQLSATNLFGYYLRGMVAKMQGDARGEAAAQRLFAAGYATEMATRRPEYLAHEDLLRAFLPPERRK